MGWAKFNRLVNGIAAGELHIRAHKVSYVAIDHNKNTIICMDNGVTESVVETVEDVLSAISC